MKGVKEESRKETIQLSFNMVVPMQEESLAGMGLLCFVAAPSILLKAVSLAEVLVMCVFGLLMSQSISQVALLPCLGASKAIQKSSMRLERMLSVVRQRCSGPRRA